MLRKLILQGVLLLALLLGVLSAQAGVVTSLADSGPGSLRQVLADASPGDTITFAVTGTITLTSEGLSINKSLPTITIIGPGADQLTIQRDPNSENYFQVFDVAGVTATIQGVTISHGATIETNNAGGITLERSTLTLNNCILSNNSGEDQDHHIAGGGIFNNGTLILNNSTLSGNSNISSGGGGIYNGGTMNSKNSIIANSTLGGNCFNRGTILTQGVNFADDNTVPGFTQVSSAQLNLGPLGDYGGPTQTFPLLFLSVAIDATPDGTDWFGNPLPTDQRGVSRPQRNQFDVGAFEYRNQPPSVNAGGNQTVIATHSGSPSTDTASLTLNGSASDPENDPLSFTWTFNTNAIVGHSPSLPQIFPPGSYTYTLTATDPFGGSSSQSVQITVNPAPNQAPAANPQSLSLNQDTNLGLTLIGSDPDGDALTYAVGTNPIHGMLTGKAPNLTYTPNAGYVGMDSLTFTVTDTYKAVSSAATVSINIKDTTPPVITLNGSNPMTINQGSVFVDPGATAVDNVDGSVPVSVSGSVNTSSPGPYTLTYSAQDSAGNKASLPRTVNVVAVAPKVTIKLTAIGQLLGVVGVVVTINNGGSTSVANVKLTSASLIGVDALLALPNNGFTLGAGKSADEALVFYPLRKGQKGTLSINGSYSGGTFNLSQSVTIP